MPFLRVVAPGDLAKLLWLYLAVRTELGADRDDGGEDVFLVGCADVFLKGCIDYRMVRHRETSLQNVEGSPPQAEAAEVSLILWGLVEAVGVGRIDILTGHCGD
jgi:hypothetical protein